MEKIVTSESPPIKFSPRLEPFLPIVVIPLVNPGEVVLDIPTPFVATMEFPAIVVVDITFSPKGETAEAKSKLT